MSAYDVYFYEAFDEEQAALKRYLPANLKAGFTRLAIGETDETAPPAKVISVRTQSVIPPGWACSLSAVLSRTTGYDTVARYLDETGSKIPCGHLPHYCARAVAEQALLLWLALLRKLPRQLEQFRAFNLTPQNRGIFNRTTLSAVKPGAVFVNVARGELSPCAELLPLVKNGTLGAVGLDVYNEEAALGAALRSGHRPDSAEAAAAFELASLPNVIFTPHNAFNTEEAVERKSEQSARQLEEFFKTGSFIWPVPR